MKISILTAAIILLCPFATIANDKKDVSKKDSKSSSTLISTNKCLLPGYQATYSSEINNHDLGVITRTVSERKPPHYQIISKLEIDKLLFSDVVTQKSVGKIRNNDIVIPNTFSLVDKKRKAGVKPLDLNKSIDKIRDKKLSSNQGKIVNDSLSYLLQLRMSIINGKMIHNFNTQTVKNTENNKIMLSSKHDEQTIKIKNSKGKLEEIKAVKIHYKDSNGADGFIWLDPKEII